MSRRIIGRFSSFSLPLAALCLTAAHPPERGPELSVAMGAGAYSSIESKGPLSDTTWEERGTEAITDLRFRAGFAKGWTLHLQQSTSPAAVIGSPDGARVITSATLARVGWHRPHGGIELGPALLYPALLWGNGPDLALSARGWLGAPRVLYGYAGLFADVTSGGPLGLIELGLGHASETFRGEIGTNWMLSSTARASVPLGRDVWIGLEAGAGPSMGKTERLDYRGLARVTFGPGVWKREGGSD